MMKCYRYITILLIFYFLSFSNQLLAIENLRFEWISERNGLSQNTVRCIIQDKIGFMWFGTINGLNRYNGKEFITMFPQAGVVNSLSDNRIRSIFEDDYGYIWIRTVGNIYNCYSTTTESFIDYAPEDTKKNYTNISSYSNGDIWLWGKNGGCCRIRHSGDELQSLYLSEQDLGTSSVLFVHEDALQQIWIGTGAGIYCLDKADRALKICEESYLKVCEAGNQLFFINNNSHILPFDLKEQAFSSPIVFPFTGKDLVNQVELLSNGIILITTKSDIMAFDIRKKTFIPAETLFDNKKIRNASFYTDNKGNKWVFNFSGRLWRQLPAGQFEELLLIPPHILATIDIERYEIYHDTRDYIWITTYGNGLFVIDTNTGQTQHYTMENSELSSNYLLCITEDKSGEIWVGTDFSGINKISTNNYPVRIFYPSPEKPYDQDNAVRMIFQDSKSHFWLGTRNSNLHVYDSTFTKLATHKIIGSLPFCAKEDHKGNVWIGTRGNGLMVFPPGDKPARNYRLIPEMRDDVFDLVIDSKNRLWVASFGGGLFYADMNVPEIKFRRIDLRSSTRNRVRVIMQDHTGIMWIGTNEGVVAFNPDELIQDDSKYISFLFDKNNEYSINNNEIKVIYEDRLKRIWFGTTGGGINLLVKEEQLGHSRFKHYTAKNGLSNEVIQGITEDSEGNIWISTEGGSGIAKFYPESEHFENFSFSNDNRIRLFNENSYWRTKTGTLMFGSYSGVYIFDPEKIRHNTYTLPIMITGLKISGVDIRPKEKDSPLEQSITLTKSIRLKHNQNSFNIEFAMLNFHSPEFNKYSYYMEGYEKKWNPVTRYNIASYRNIPPGNYRFKVKGSNSFGIWTEKDTVLEINVLPPFWKSGWAYLFYLVFAAGLMFALIKNMLHIHRLHTAVEVERQMTEYKLVFFTNISHEFRTPLTIIKGAIESLTDTKNLPPSVVKLITQMEKSSLRLLQLVDQLLEFRKLQKKGLELKVERTEIVGFFHEIYLTFEEVANKKNIQLLFESNLQQHEMFLDVSKFDKIGYNLLSNAIKHTPENGIIRMKLFFSAKDDLMTLSVADSGPGIPAEKRASLFVRFAQFSNMQGGTGIGLHLTAELVGVHKGKIKYSDSEWGGACFTVSIPLADVHYLKEQNATLLTTPIQIATDVNSDKTEEEQEEVTVSNNFNKYKILVIEDEEDIRDFIISQLKEHFKILSAKNGTEGLEKVSQEQPDLIICDVMMPGISGLEVTKSLKDNFLTCHIPVILLTAHSSEEHQVEGIQMGADSYITKPFSIKYLLARVIKLIEQREKLRQKFTQEPGNSNQLTTFVEKDKEFLNKINRLIEKNMGNPNFSVTDMFTNTTHIGRTSFYKKLNGLTGYTPNEYLRIIRLKKAAELLSTTDMNISEISYHIGIIDPLYFSKLFKTQFKKTPSEYRKGG